MQLIGAYRLCLEPCKYGLQVATPSATAAGYKQRALVSTVASCAAAAAAQVATFVCHGPAACGLFAELRGPPQGPAVRSSIKHSGTTAIMLCPNCATTLCKHKATGYTYEWKDLTGAHAENQ